MADDTILENDQTYFAGNTNGTCEDRDSVTVTLDDSPNAGATTSITVCSTDDSFDILDVLNPSILGDADQGGTISPALESGTTIFDPAVDASTQYIYTVASVNEECPDDEARITITVLEGPNAGENGSIEFNREDDPVNLITYLLGNDPDLGGTWSPGNEDGEFDPATGEAGVYTYTVTNDNECQDLATVTVTFSDEPIEECPEVTQSEQSFCESIGEGNNFRRPRVSDLSPANAVWYDSADSETALADDTILENDETYFAGNTNGTCEERDSVTVTLDDSPNAGATTSITVCSTGEEFDILDELNPSILGEADQGGTISPALASGTTIFDPSADTAGQYIYTVQSTNEACPDDEARITITIEDALEADAGSNVQAEYCSNEGVVDLYSLVPEGTTTEGIFEGYENGNFDTANNLNTTEITYVVSSESGCFDGVSEAIYTITVNEAPDAGDNVNLEYCITDIEEMTEVEVLQIFTSLLGDRDQNGSFPEGQTPMDLYATFSANPIGTFSTTYTVTNENCIDSAELSITINDTEEANAGGDVDNIIVCSTDADINLFDYLSEDVTQEGYFEELEDGIFSPSTSGVGPFTFTFTVDPTSDCVTGSDSAIYSVEVLQGPNAGENGNVEFTREDDPVNLFAYLNGTPDEGGTWTPGNTDGSFDPATDAAGTYTYTVTNENECQDSATVTVTFSDEPIEECPEVTESEQAFCESIGEGNEARQPTVSDLLPANAVWYDSADSETALDDDTILEDGETYFAGNINGTCEDRDSVNVTLDDSPNAGATTFLEVCTSDDAFDILDVLNPSILGEAEEGGTISPALASGTTIFDPSVDTARQYIYTVSSTNEACPDDEARITITFAQGANAGEDMAVTVCSNDGQQDLYDLISADADIDGEFTLEGEVVADGIMDPAGFEAGTYEVIYTVTAGENAECGGDDMSTITITLGEAPEAPTTGEAVAFCAIDGETATRLEADGTNLTWYSDADLTMMVSQEDLLINGDYYVTQASDEGCESEAAVLTVNIVDSPAPTISSDYELCEFDNPTIAALTAEINESGEVTWYDSADSMTALSNNATLTDGTTYYATLISDNGCESSERLAVTVTLEQCAIIPEAITPNGDNKNDTFSIGFLENDYPNFNVIIFNRWGNAVYKGNASTPEWDGTSNQSGSLGDDVLPVGVYFYVVDFNDGSTEPRQGKVYLNR
ncbi:gliding motility-associated C-terminal domain-containing protein [Salegentibacter salegens]|uniref:Gliding motility-associated C-terminal domain-containing protein n=1 Tax=Salegentibacter salegens TaxID=143223 RepID=A0A1M7HUI7_9FLAO|nr:gliding motility-associated C-terminal domain-containing protein [Salegentibacter salegens]PRX40189.1 gliding motility-associated-like protein [Salegentibacter salegens]SHM32221.1 gliding motility-associated C-terminal domain-containing protein [Salegentibacter salegens]